MQRVTASRSFVVGFLLLLSSCFYSEKPLFGAGDTPLPPSFRMAAVKEANGSKSFEFDEHNSPRVFDFNQGSSDYVFKQAGSSTPGVLTLVAWDTSRHLYAMQVKLYLDDNRVKYSVYYGLMKIDGQDVIAYTPSDRDKQLTDQLKAAGVKFEDGFMQSFSDRDQLNKALGVFASRLAYADRVQFVLASTPAQLSQLQSDLRRFRGVASNAPSSTAQPSANTDQPDEAKTAAGVIGALLLWSFKNGQNARGAQPGFDVLNNPESRKNEESLQRLREHNTYCDMGGSALAGCP